MRILHTSDWHLGRAFHGASLLAEQEAAVDRIVELAEERKVELVIIAGDLYDRAIPPADAVALFDDALLRLQRTGASVVAIAGNHDSATRVSINDQLLAHAGVSVRGDTSRITDPLILTPDDGGSAVAVYLIPFLEPSVSGPILNRLDDHRSGEHPGGDHGEQQERGEHQEVELPRTPGRLSHHDVTAHATDLIRTHMDASNPRRAVLVAHTFITGGATSDSERELRIGPVGDVDMVGLDAFRDFDYVALGHLHGDQSWDNDRVAYSGTPLPYSFSEEGHTKSVRIVDLAADGSISVDVIPLEVGRQLRTITGTLDELLADPDLADAEEARVRVELTDSDLPMQAMSRIQMRFPHAVVLHHQPSDRKGPRHGAARGAIAEEPSPIELVRHFWEDQHGAEASNDHLKILEQALTAAGKGEVNQ